MSNQPKPRTLTLNDVKFEAIHAAGGTSGLCTDCHFATNPGCAESAKKDDCRKGTPVIWIKVTGEKK